eukprot:5949478-Amphidinium_carterae.1
MPLYIVEFHALRMESFALAEGRFFWVALLLLVTKERKLNKKDREGKRPTSNGVNNIEEAALAKKRDLQTAPRSYGFSVGRQRRGNMNLGMLSNISS